MKKLEQGDYVVNLSEEHFYELIKIANQGNTLDYNTNKVKSIGTINCSLCFIDGFLLHTFNYYISNKLTFDEFKQRAINTFSK